MFEKLKHWLFPHIKRYKAQHDVAQALIIKLQDELALFKERVEHLENHHEDAYAVEVRQVQNIVNADFSKFEMVLMMSGVLQLAKAAKSVEDMEILTKLSRKIEGVMVLMNPEQEFTSTRGKK